jgi:RNA polymerase sigma factor (sigma-70 family)
MPLATSPKLADILEQLSSSRKDEQAWLMLYKSLWPILIGTSFRILRGNRALAEDASQEALLRILRYARFEDFAGDSEGFKAYVKMVSRNVSRDYLEKLLQQPIGGSEADDRMERLPDQNARDSEREYIRQELASSFYATLEQTDRELLELLQGGTAISEISRALGVSYTNAAVRIHRLRQKVSIFMKIHGI